jgi:urease subunit gamma/beta
MHLTPREIDKLLLHAAGALAQKRLARGLLLNYPEAVALLSAQLLELVRDGHTVAVLMDLGRRILGRSQVLDGVPEMIREVQIEGTFADGTKLVTVHDPIVLERGDPALAFHGSTFVAPAEIAARASGSDAVSPGAIDVIGAAITLNAGADAIELSVKNVGDRPIQVGSHYPFADVNGALVFERARAVGRRLDIPAGTAVRFEPGDEKTVRLVTTASP